jgi:hypothetical protein
LNQRQSSACLALDFFVADFSDLSAGALAFFRIGVFLDGFIDGCV